VFYTIYVSDICEKETTTGSSWVDGGKGNLKTDYEAVTKSFGRKNSGHSVEDGDDISACECSTVEVELGALTMMLLT
jgi:hypothetical protein